MSFVAQAIQRLGPEPQGDPSQMLEGAGQLLSLAAELESQASAMQASAIAGAAGPFARAAAAAADGDANSLRTAASIRETRPLQEQVRSNGMNQHDDDRATVLGRLISGSSTPADAVRELRAWGWDAERELATLRRADALAALDRFCAADIDAAQLSAWAEAIEGREDIAFEPGFDILLGDLVFELANPAITEHPTRSRARDWIARLRSSTPSA